MFPEILTAGNYLFFENVDFCADPRFGSENLPASQGQMKDSVVRMANSHYQIEDFHKSPHFQKIDRYPLSKSQETLETPFLKILSRLGLREK